MMMTEEIKNEEHEIRSMWWDDLRKRFASRPSVKSALDMSRMDSWKEGWLAISCPSVFLADFLDKEAHYDEIKKVASEISGENTRIQLSCHSQSQGLETPAPEVVPAANEWKMRKFSMDLNTAWAPPPKPKAKKSPVSKFKGSLLIEAARQLKMTKKEFSKRSGLSVKIFWNWTNKDSYASPMAVRAIQDGVPKVIDKYLELEEKAAKKPEVALGKDELAASMANPALVELFERLLNESDEIYFAVLMASRNLMEKANKKAAS